MREHRETPPRLTCATCSCPQQLNIGAAFPVAKAPLAFYRGSVKHGRTLRLSAYLNWLIALSPNPLPDALANFVGYVPEEVLACEALAATEEATVERARHG